MKPKNVGGAPPRYDDEELLSIAAEILAWQVNGITRIDMAIRQAIAFVPGSDDTDSKDWVETTVERLRKKFREEDRGAALVAASKARKQKIRMHAGRAFVAQGPDLPQLLSLPLAPEAEHARRRARQLLTALEALPAVAVAAADILRRHLLHQDVPDPKFQSIADEAAALLTKLRRLGE